MAQKEALINQKIATISAKDGSQMKAIAVLTMVFLPSTAMAVGTHVPSPAGMKLMIFQTIFAMPLIRWPIPPDGQRIGTEFKWFVVIATLMTFFVLLLWQVWIHHKGLRLRGKKPKPTLHLPLEDFTPSGDKIV